VPIEARRTRVPGANLVAADVADKAEVAPIKERPLKRGINKRTTDNKKKTYGNIGREYPFQSIHVDGGNGLGRYERARASGGVPSNGDGPGHLSSGGWLDVTTSGAAFGTDGRRGGRRRLRLGQGLLVQGPFGTPAPSLHRLRAFALRSRGRRWKHRDGWDEPSGASRVQRLPFRGRLGSGLDHLGE